MGSEDETFALPTVHLLALPESALVTVWLAADDRAYIRDWVASFLTKWRHVRPKTGGDQLRQLGLPPGPAYAEILDSLRAGWLDREIESEADEQKALNVLLKSAGHDG